MKSTTLVACLFGLLLKSNIAVAQATTDAKTTTAGGNAVATYSIAGATSAAVAATTTPRPTTLTTTTKVPPPTLALTTILTPPASCQTYGFTYFKTLNNATNVFWRNLNSVNNDANTAPCYPTSFRAVALSNGYYSPGVCPSGWHAAEVIHTRTTAAWTSWCCPGDMRFDGTACTSTVTTPTSIFVAAGTQRPISSTWIAVDWPIQVVWESDDLKEFSPASAPLRTSSDPVSSQLGNSGKDSSGDSSTSSSELSGGAIAGIVIGAMLGLLLLFALVWFLLRRRRQQLRPYTGPSELAMGEKSEMSGEAMAYELSSGNTRNELYAGDKLQRAELHGAALQDEAAKSHGSNGAAELDGGQYDHNAKKAHTVVYS